jgi:hypothetical protein
LWFLIVVPDDDNGHRAIWRFVRRDLQSALTGTRLSGDHDAIGHAGARRLCPVVVGNGQPARVGLEIVHRVEPDSFSDRNKRAERAMRTQHDPFFPWFPRLRRSEEK